MQFRLLGPLEVDAGEGPIPLGGPKQRAVLANLLVRANEVVPADALIGDVWGSEAPDTARHILQTYVSSLRRSLGEGRLEGRPPGYRLAVEPFEIDALRFASLVTDAKKALVMDPDVAIATFDDALALWRGPALADLNDQPSLLPEAARLDELRLDAQEARIEGLLAAGAHGGAMAELEPLLAQHPLRESLWGLAMLAAYRAGRQADALGAFGRARELLADELGIDPSTELTRLHERILRQDPALELRGEPLRGYRLLERIDEGRLGVVFRGIQPHVGRDVAVKVLHERIAADPAFVASFERVAQAVVALEHPHIVPVHDYWRESGRAYVVSRYMRGGSLQALIDRGGTIDRERAVSLIADVAAALGFAHRQGVAHGAVRPSNILFDGERNPYLGDFHVGAGPAARADDDLRELRRFSRDLLSPSMPPALGAILLDPGDGADGADADAIADAAGCVLEPRATAPAPHRAERNPYKGLRAFTEADAFDFFGRSHLTERFVARLREPVAGARFLAVVGPSGGGKSSAVRAGLVPALRRESPGGTVLVADLFPGAHPLGELEAALLRVATRPSARIGDFLRSGSRGLLEAVDQLLPEDAELVLVVDQLEELFTLTTDALERELVMDAIRVVTVDPQSKVRVIVTLRADFYDRPLAYPRFAELLATRNETVPPLTADELEQAIRSPAERQGVGLEHGLVAEMIADVAHEPGGLPLLQYALTELFDRREGDRLTLDAYRDIGGVTGALSARADRLLVAADEEGRRAIEQVFLRLVTLGEGRQDTRRRVALGELDALDVSSEAVGSALEAYGRHRLLTFDREPSTREPTVEIAHEALLRAWGRLGSWIDRARDDLRQYERLARAAAEWRGSGGESSFLIGGARLEQVESWVSGTSLSIGQRERAYLKASVERRREQEERARIRREREAEVERRSVRRLRGLVAVFAVAAIVAGSLTIVATDQGGRAQEQARIARARELAAASVSNLEVDPERSILLAIEAVRTTRSVDGTVLPEAEEALHRAVVASRIVTRFDGVGGRLDWSPSGVFAAEATGSPGTIDIRDAETGAVVRSFHAHDGAVTDVAFKDDGELLASTGEDGWLKVWDPSTGALVARVGGDRGVARGPSFDGDGSVVSAAWAAEGLARVLELSSGEVREFPGLPRANGTALSPDGRQVAVSRGTIGVSADGDWMYPVVAVFGIDTGEELRRLQPKTGLAPSAVAWSPDGRFIAAGQEPHIWDAATGRLRSVLFGHDDEVWDLDWSDDASRLVTGSFDGTVKVWDVSRPTPLELMTLSGQGMDVVESVAISPDGSQVMAGDVSPDVVTVWGIGPAGDAEWANFPSEKINGDVAFAPTGHRVFATHDDGSVQVWDPAEGSEYGPLESFAPMGRGCCAVDIHTSSDGSILAITYWGGMVSVRDVTTGDELLATRADRWLTEVDLSPSGRLLAVATPRGAVEILDLTGRIVRVLHEDGVDLGVPVFVGPDDRLLATAPEPWWDPATTRVRIWDWRLRRVVGTIPTGTDPADPPVFDLTAGVVATYARLGQPEVWDVETGELVATASRQPGDIYDLAFSPDGSLLATASTDGTVRLFDAGSGLQRLTLFGPGQARGLSFSADGSMLASLSDGTIRVWALDIDDLLRIARDNVTRSFTDDECRLYLHLERCTAA